MNNIVFRPFNNKDKNKVGELIKLLYTDDPQGKAMTDEKIHLTFNMLDQHPDYGSIIVLENLSEVVGYAILINFWSNEYGGIILTIDELVISPKFRNQGMGTAFIKYLQTSHFQSFVALKLEVLPYNVKALHLYQKLGFKQANRHHLIYEK